MCASQIHQGWKKMPEKPVQIEFFAGYELQIQRHNILHHAWETPEIWPHLQQTTFRMKKGHTSDKMSPIITVVRHACLVCDIPYTFVMWDSHMNPQLVGCSKWVALNFSTTAPKFTNRNLEQCCLHEHTLTFFFLGFSVSLDWESIQNVWKSVGTKHSFERWMLLIPTKMCIVYCIEVMLKMMMIHGSHYW